MRKSVQKRRNLFKKKLTWLGPWQAQSANSKNIVFCHNFIIPKIRAGFGKVGFAVYNNINPFSKVFGNQN